MILWPQLCGSNDNDSHVFWVSTCIHHEEISNKSFPDHATFREKGAKLACADKLGVFLSLTLCNKAKFDPLQRVKYDGLEKM